MGGGGGVEQGKQESGKEAGRHSPTACRAEAQGGGEGKGQHDRDQASARGSREPGERGAQPEAIGAEPTGELEGAAPAYKTGFLCSECHRRTSPDLRSGKAVWAGMWDV